MAYAERGRRLKAVSASIAGASRHMPNCLSVSHKYLAAKRRNSNLQLLFIYDIIFYIRVLLASCPQSDSVWPPSSSTSRSDRPYRPNRSAQKPPPSQITCFNSPKFAKGFELPIAFSGPKFWYRRSCLYVHILNWHQYNQTLVQYSHL